MGIPGVREWSGSRKAEVGQHNIKLEKKRFHADKGTKDEWKLELLIEFNGSEILDFRSPYPEIHSLQKKLARLVRQRGKQNNADEEKMELPEDTIRNSLMKKLRKRGREVTKRRPTLLQVVIK